MAEGEKPARLLKKPPLAEVILELRFAAPVFPELLVGVFISNPAWPGYKLERLPLADIPQAMRRADPMLSVQPTLELKRENSCIRLGDHVLSYHLTPPYLGWPSLKETLGQIIDFAFVNLVDLQVSRAGLRCINLFTEAEHNVRSLDDLEIRLEVAGRPLGIDANLNYIRHIDANCMAMVKIASAGFVANPGVPDVTVLFDVDAFTPPECILTEASAVKAWVSDAHEVVSREFFSVFTTKMSAELEESNAS